MNIGQFKKPVLILVGLSLIGGIVNSIRTPDGMLNSLLSGTSKDQKLAIQPIVVEAEPAKQGRITRKITAVGSLLANQDVALRPEVQGLVTKVHFQNGVEVAKNAPIIEVDPTNYAAQYKEALAKYNFHKAVYNRLKVLTEKKFGSQQKLEEAEAAYEAAEASRNIAKSRLDKTVIKAPFEGVLSLNNIGVGSFVSEQKEILTIVDVDPIKIDFTIPSSFLQSVKVGQNVKIRVDGFNDMVREAKIESIDSRVDPNSFSILARAIIDNKDRTLKPGLFARVEVEVGVKEDATLVPENAVDGNGEEKWVYKVSNGKANKVLVETGNQDGDIIEITQGIRPGDMVITAGIVKVGNGYPVKIVEPGTIRKIKEQQTEGMSATGGPMIPQARPQDPKKAQGAPSFLQNKTQKEVQSFLKGAAQ